MLPGLASSNAWLTDLILRLLGRDCFVTQLEGEETELEHILACYPSRLDFLRVSSRLIDCLYDQMMLWPKPGGFGVVYSNRGGEVSLLCFNDAQQPGLIACMLNIDKSASSGSFYPCQRRWQ